MFREAMKCINQHDAPSSLLDDNVSKHGQRDAGNSKAYTLTRLQKDNPEEDAKKASRSARAAEMVKAGTHTQAEAARELGISEPAVHKELTKEKVTLKKVKTIKPPQPTIKLADPHRTAANIHAKNQKVKMTL